jgi:CheY-like chemotaxis protein
MANALKILLVEDNKTDAVLIEDMIYQADANGSADVNYELVHKEMLRDALKYLAENTVDVILLDLSLPDSKGLETVKKMGEGGRTRPLSSSQVSMMKPPPYRRCNTAFRTI